MGQEQSQYLPDQEFVNWTRDLLEQKNPLLRPDMLAPYIAGFERFIPYRKQLGMWRRLEYHTQQVQLLRERRQGTDFQVGLVNFAGIFAGGKNTLADVVNKRLPDFWEFAVSATSRDIRTDDDGNPVELDGVDYLFRKGRWFAEQLARGELLNSVRIGAEDHDPPEMGTWYGFPAASLGRAWKKSPLAYVHTTIDKWENFQSGVRRVFSERNPLFLGIHMWPELRFLDYVEHLKVHRPDDHERRTNDAVRELLFAAREARVVMVNRFGIAEEAETLMETRASAVVHLITNHFADFIDLNNASGGWVPRPEMSLGIVITESVLTVQNYHERGLMTRRDWGIKS